MPSDALVFEETDPGFFLGVARTHVGRFVVIDTHDHETSEVWLIDAHDPAARAAPRRGARARRRVLRRIARR